jgi:hypothetical protein
VLLGVECHYPTKLARRAPRNGAEGVPVELVRATHSSSPHPLPGGREGSLAAPSVGTPSTGPSAQTSPNGMYSPSYLQRSQAFGPRSNGALRALEDGAPPGPGVGEGGEGAHAGSSSAYAQPAHPAHQGITSIGGLVIPTAEVNAMIDSLYTSADLQGSLYASSELQESEKMTINSEYQSFMVSERYLKPESSRSTAGLIDDWITSLSKAAKVEMIASFFIHFAGLSCPLHPSFIRAWEAEPPILLHAIWALGAIHTFSVSPHEKHRFFAGDPFYFKARSMVDGMLSKPASISAVITLCLLALYGSSSGRETVSFAFASQAIRMALELRLNIDPSLQDALDAMSWRNRETRRRVWWLCFILDRWTSTDASFFVDEGDCLCQSPMSSELWNALSPDMPEHVNESALRLELNAFASSDLYLPSISTNNYVGGGGAGGARGGDGALARARLL